MLARPPARQGRRRDAVLHGRGLARARRTRDLEPVADDGARRARRSGLETCATLGHAEAGAGRDAEGRRARLLQPQPRHRAGVLREDHHHARPTRIGSTRSRACARPASRSAAAASSAWARRASDRAALLQTLATLDPQPESRCRSTTWCRSGTPLRGTDAARPVRVRAHDRRRAHPDAAARSCACPPAARAMSDELQALCFLAGANSIFYGEKLLTTGNPDVERRSRLFARLGLVTRAARPAEHGEARPRSCRPSETRDEREPRQCAPGSARDPPLIRSSHALRRRELRSRRDPGAAARAARPLRSCAARRGRSRLRDRPRGCRARGPISCRARARGRLERRHAARGERPRRCRARPSRRSAATQSGCRCATRAFS